MASEKMLEVEESQDTPQAITITIVDPSALGNTSLDSSLVASVETQDGPHPGSSIVMVSGDGHDAKNLLQTVTETHMGTEDLPIISNISNTEEDEDEEEETIVHETKLCDGFDGGGEEAESGDPYEVIAPHCLVCNVDLTPTVSDDHVPVFKTQTSTSQRRVAIFLSSLIGQTLTSRKAHSDILCRRCFNLLDRVDSLEVEIKETKEEIVNKYQETVSVYGGRARRRRKPPTAKQKDYVFPKVEPEDEEEQLLDMEVDGNFEPQMDDLMDEEPNLQDDDWEPELKKPRIKKETSDVPETVPIPPKRKRGRPRKDATRPKGSEDDTCVEEEEGDISQLLQATPHLKHFLSPGQDGCSRPTLTCISCNLTFTAKRSLLAHRCTYECVKCGTEKGSVGTLIEHLQLCSSVVLIQNKDVSLSCKFCTDVFQTESQLQDHIKEHTNHCLKQYSLLLKERGQVYSSLSRPHPTLKKGRPRKSSECPKCGLIYSSLSHLTRHLKQVHPDSLPHACRLCYDKFFLPQELEAHIVLHFLGSFKCEFCGICFGLKYPFLRHLEAQHPGDFLFKCEFCKFTSSSFMEYRQHRRQPHELNGAAAAPGACQYCDELVPQDELEEHIEEHLSQQKPQPVTVKPPGGGSNTSNKRRRKSGKKLPHCPECDITFSSPGALSRHNHKQHPYKYSKQCDVCGHRFKGERALKMHQEGHQTGNCWCPVCKLRFSQRHHVEQHFLRSHADVPTIDCEYCNASLGSYSKYLYHCHTTHAELLEDRADLKCTHCDECLPNHILLNQHMARHHGYNQQNAPKSMCPVCKKYFVHIDVHMNVHTRAVEFPCDVCGEVFFMHSSLLAHRKLRHDQNAKTHLCTTCGKKFISNSLLQYHHDQVHLHKRQHCCEYCGHAYKTKSALTYHLKAHTGERPYKCDECGMGFHRPSTLKTHIEGTHFRPYPYLYRKPHRRAGTGIVTEGKKDVEKGGTECNKQANSDTMEVSAEKSVILGDKVGIEMGSKEDKACGDEEDLGEMVTVVEELRDLSTLYGEESQQSVYVIQAFENS